MKLDYKTPTVPINSIVRVGKRNAYHQAGRVAAIHFGNKQKNLPVVHFQITIKPANQDSEVNGRSQRIPDKHRATLEGGRLIPNLPYSFQSATRLLSPPEQQHCRCAFEADVINLLAASLAEAKYVALRDDEIFNANLVYLGALKFYGGKLDLLTVDEYMDCLYPASKTERDQKLTELFLAAYSFVNKSENWQAITALAESIHGHPQDIFTCEELIALLVPSNSVGMTGQGGIYAERLLGSARH
jgi:hypothetical protein